MKKIKINKNKFSKKKVLVIGLGDNIGGIEVFYMNYYNLICDEFIIDFAYFTPTIAFKEEIEQKGSKTFNLPNLKKHPLKYIKALKKIIKQNQYDIIHINMLSSANILPILIAKKCNVEKIILHSHSSSTPSGIIRKILVFINKKIICNKKRYIYLACSKKAGDWMFGKKTKYSIIKNAISVEKFKYNDKCRKTIRKNNNILKNDFLIGHIGRFCEVKNHKFIIDIIDKLVEQDARYKLIFIGNGPLESNIKAEVHKRNLEKNVIFKGSLPNTNEYYSSFDLFILPSLFEGLPIVGVEAQTNGVPCLFSKNISLEVKMNSNIKFLPVNDYSVWVKEIINLKMSRVNNLKEIDKFGYNIAVESKKLIDIYN